MTFVLLTGTKCFSKFWLLYFQGFLLENEVCIFGYARTKITDEELRNRLHG
jgi:glucose-6-phosphate 1-dehydrogenase